MDQPQQEEPDQQHLDAVNIAKKLDKDLLKKIGRECKAGFDLDDKSRNHWLMEISDWIKLTQMRREVKDFPWENASNVKYPLIATAAMQFSARAYPSLVPSDGEIVKAKIIGADPDGSKSDRGDRVSKYMSWQIMYEMKRWEEDMDRMLMMVACMGMMFKKTYYDRLCEKPVSELVYPENFVVDYWATDLDDAERYSEVIYLSERRLKQRQKTGEYLDCELGAPSVFADSNPHDENNMPPPHGDMALLPYKLVSQACWYDLDKDDVDEPYTVLFHHATGQVLKITPRFDEDGVKTDDKGKVTSYKAHCYYTKFNFIPNPDGSFYDLGFGHLLGPLNESVNTILNQLIDAGTVSNLQSGFIGKSIRLRMGDTPLQPGEWRAVNAVGDDLRKQIVPLPSKDPSEVLFKLLDLLVASGKELASIAEIFVGKMPGQNTPATTTQSSIEQGMKVFTSIYKRIYRSLDKEFKKLFKINSKYLDFQEYSEILDVQVNPQDFDSKLFDIIPSADPTSSTAQEKLAKSEALLQLIQLGTIDPTEVTIRIVQAQEQPDWQKLIPGMAQTGKPQIQPKEDPKVQAIKLQAQAKEKESQLKQQEMQQKMVMAQQTHQDDLQAQQQQHAMELQAKQAELQQQDQANQQQLQAKMASNAVDQQHANTMNQMGQQHTQSMNKMKEQHESTRMATASRNSGSHGGAAGKSGGSKK